MEMSRLYRFMLIYILGLIMLFGFLLVTAPAQASNRMDLGHWASIARQKAVPAAPALEVAEVIPDTGGEPGPAEGAGFPSSWLVWLVLGAVAIALLVVHVLRALAVPPQR